MQSRVGREGSGAHSLARGRGVSGQVFPNVHTFPPTLPPPPKTPVIDWASPIPEFRGISSRTELQEYGHKTPNNLGVGSQPVR